MHRVSEQFNRLRIDVIRALHLIRCISGSSGPRVGELKRRAVDDQWSRVLVEAESAFEKVVVTIVESTRATRLAN